MIDLIRNNDHFILIALLLTVCMQMSFFAIAYTLKFDKVTDLAGTSSFAVLALLTLILKSGAFWKFALETGQV